MATESTERLKFPNNLRSLREDAGIGVTEVAREASLSDRTLRDTEDGLRSPRPHNKNKIVRALNNLIRRSTKVGDPIAKQYKLEEVFPVTNQPSTE